MVVAWERELTELTELVTIDEHLYSIIGRCCVLVYEFDRDVVLRRQIKLERCRIEADPSVSQPSLERRRDVQRFCWRTWHVIALPLSEQPTFIQRSSHSVAILLTAEVSDHSPSKIVVSTE